MRDIDKSLKDLQVSVYKSLPNGKPKVDKSKRKFISKPFLFKAGLFIPVSNSRIHFLAHVEILGDRRPYTIYIESVKMRKSGASFVPEGTDKVISEQIAKTIKYELSKRLKNIDVIDDFRVF